MHLQTRRNTELRTENLAVLANPVANDLRCAILVQICVENVLFSFHFHLFFSDLYRIFWFFIYLFFLQRYCIKIHLNQPNLSSFLEGKNWPLTAVNRLAMYVAQLTQKSLPSNFCCKHAGSEWTHFLALQNCQFCGNYSISSTKFSEQL